MSIVLTEISDFKIDRELLSSIDQQTGEINISLGDGGKNIGAVPLLYNDDGSGINIANNWLIHLKANLNLKYVGTQAQGLLHYFTFLSEIGYLWDDMPFSQRKRPTYLFKKHLVNSFKQGVLARSTAASYMRVVVKFYKFYISRRYGFDNPPFQYEEVKVKMAGSHEYMRGQNMRIETTDLRLNLPRNDNYYGVPRKLIPLSTEEWKLVNRLCLVEKKGLRKTTETMKLVPISKEFQIAVLLSRFCGLRREEIISLPASIIYKPSASQLARKGYLIDKEGLVLEEIIGVRTKNRTIRTAEIPVELMQLLHDYINSKRYIERKNKFLLNPDNKGNKQSPPLLISQNGTEYSKETLNARWGEVRNYARRSYKNFDHKFHNLRSTYAVSRLKELLNGKISEAAALDYLQAVMGQKDRVTLLRYLKLCQVGISANQEYEEALELIIKSEC